MELIELAYSNGVDRINSMFRDLFRVPFEGVALFWTNGSAYLYGQVILLVRGIAALPVGTSFFLCCDDVGVKHWR